MFNHWRARFCDVFEEKNAIGHNLTHFAASREQPSRQIIQNQHFPLVWLALFFDHVIENPLKR
jgi:hypothetical protein